MTALLNFVILYFYWKILSLGIFAVTSELTFSANSNFIEPFKPVTFNCTASEPLDTSIAFAVDGIKTVRILYQRNKPDKKCLLEHFGNNSVIECNHTCACLLDGKSYTWVYKDKVNNETMIFSCEALIGSGKNRSLEQEHLVLSKAKTTAIRTIPNQAAFYINETEGPNGIDCIADCVPDCSYKWTSHAGLENNSILSIPYARRNQTGNYTCTAWNNFGSITTTIEIFVQYRPLVKITPDINPYKIQENHKNLVIKCVVNDAFPMDPVWYIITKPSGQHIQSQSFNISLVKKEDHGTYTCSARNAAGSSDGASLTVDVLYGPLIAEMNNVNITEGRSVKQICNVTANPKTTRVWWTRSKDSNFTRRETELDISNISRQLSDTFTCYAENQLDQSDGNTRNIINNRSMSINVQFGPEIITMKDVNVTELSDFTTTCNVTANPVPTRVWWTHMQLDNFVQESSVLNLTKILKTRSGCYICHAENILHPTYLIYGDIEKKNASRSFYLNVQYGPVISYIDDVHVIENAPYNRKCNVSSNPLVHRVWWTRSKTSQVYNGTDLMFSAIKREDTDLFTCHAENILYPSDSDVEVRTSGNRSFNINVQYGPGNSIHILPPFVSINVTEAKDIINITCQADCNPPCSYQWTNSSSIGIQDGHLLDTDVRRADAGNYTCLANTTITTNISTISLEINVLYAASILNISSVTTVNESHGYILECKVDSFPLSKITWKLNRTNEIMFSETGVKISKYSVRTASCNQTGTYACAAYSGISPEALKYTELRILCTPRYNSKYHSPMSPIGIGDAEPLNITVHFIAYPIPIAISWIFYQNNSSEFIKKKSNCYSYDLFEHVACFFKSNVTKADFGTYKLQVHYTDSEIWQEEFVVVGNRRPDQPQQVNISCEIEEVYISWKPGFNGGEKQTFYILVVAAKSSKLIISKNVDNGPEIILADGIILQSGEYSFAIFTNNSYGNATSEISNCTVNARKLPIIGPPSVISAIVGSIAGIIVICAVAVAVFLFVRHRFSKNKKTDKDMLQRSCLHSIDDEEGDGLKDNPMYVTSEPHRSEQKSSSDVYSVVNKRKGSSVESQQKNDSAVYSQVVRKNKKGKENAVKKEKQVKDKFLEMDSVYENSNDTNKRQTDDVYANTTGKELLPNQKNAMKNKDGLIYADLDLAMSPSGSKFVIRGLENRNNYAIIDLTKTAEPLPPDSDSEDVNEQGKESKEKYEKQ